MSESHFIPDSIVANILSRLPPDSLLRFKSCCKSWNSLISDPYFATLQFNRSSQNPKFLFKFKRRHFRVLDFQRSSFEKFSSSSLQFPLVPDDCSLLRILGSSCGLICLAYERPIPSELYLWNPFTREFRNIPHLLPNLGWEFTYAHGLGYNPDSNNLKLFVSKRFPYTCNVFCMKSNSWTSIECPPKFNSLRYPLVDPKAIAVNGVFHWLIKKPVSSLRIIGFDSTKHEFLKVAKPEIALRNYFRNACLLEHKGLLLISFCRRYVEEEMWMLKEHFWIPFLRIKTLHPLKGRDPYRPICIYGRRIRVILHNEVSILRSTNGVDEIEEIGPPFSYIHEAIICFETLISPNHIILEKK